jgi:hypothetical protein
MKMNDKEWNLTAVVLVGSLLLITFFALIFCGMPALGAVLFILVIPFIVLIFPIMM